MANRLGESDIDPLSNILGHNGSIQKEHLMGIVRQYSHIYSVYR